MYKFDWSLCNQAVQNSEINMLPRVSPLTVILYSSKSQVTGDIITHNKHRFCRVLSTKYINIGLHVDLHKSLS